VLLLEAGGRNNSLDIRMPAGIARALFKPRYNWQYPALADPTRNGTVDSWSGGRGLGGSSSINGMLFIRGAPADYDGWAESGCSGWDYESVLPHFRDIESFEGGGDRYRGGAGPLSVSFPAAREKLIDLWIDAACSGGHHRNPDYNGAEHLGAARAQSSIRRGRRHSTAEAFIKPVRHRPNLEVRTGCQVTRILIENGRARAVEYQRDGSRETVRSAGEIVVSCGAIASPRLLMHSGIGPEATLREQGIEVLMDVPAVGENLMEHPAIYVKAFTSLPTFNRAGRLYRGPFVLLDWLLRGRGAAAVGTAVGQLLAKSSEQEIAADLQVLLTLANFSVNATGTGVVLGKRDGFSMACCLLTPRSRGRVTLTSPDPLEKPVVQHRMLDHEEDLDRLAEAGRSALTLLDSAPLRDFIEEVDFPLAADAPRDEWHSYLRQSAFRADHPSGTCRMGADESAVVDPRLRVRGVDGLRVVDASIIPVIPRANTNAPVMMIAHKAAAMISEDASACSAHGRPR
jgi:choline dehydrogenase